MIDASSGGDLMNKTQEEAWEMIETVVYTNQHFSTRAKSRSVYEVAPSKSTLLAKSLVDIATMLKEIKEGQQVTLTLLKRQADTTPSRNRSSISGFALATPITRMSVHNSKRTMYQPPHNRQQYPPPNNPPMSQVEALRAFQKENQETREFQKQTQVQPQPQHQPQPPILNPLPSQPLPNPKGGLNAINDDPESEEEAEDTNDEEAEQQLYELLLEMTGSKSEEDEDAEEILNFCEEFDSDYKEDESKKKGELKDEWGKEAETQNDKGEVLFVNTISDENGGRAGAPPTETSPLSKGGRGRAVKAGLGLFFGFLSTLLAFLVLLSLP
ncbi:hypothetical protein PIB30_017903 [Stylosanthes scabra]|uniref:Uncharacterized protein n=1 Tax=Stylosanthes scabra TaxID=79078 RepID=A0ABU6Q7J5_9FABA|nr:hypothetical protein [Stylosanthes scabra]